MNRRKAMKFGLLAGGMVPAALARAGDDLDEFDDPAPTRRRRSAAPARDEEIDLGDDSLGDGLQGGDAMPPDNFKDEIGHSWKSFDIARYVSMAYTPENPKPQNALVEWIFRRTGSALWHGEKIAVLSAGKAQLRAYHNPKVLKVVEEYAERFTRATADVLSVRVRFVAAQDTRWRYAVYNRLKRIGSGSQGQQIWTVAPDDANLVRSQMLLYQGFKLLADKNFKMLNGQTMSMDTADVVDFISSTQSDGAAGVGAQPRTDQLKEGAFLRFSPLLTFDGDAIDAAIEFRATTVKRLIRTKILARREVGPADVSIDVPEVIETRLNRTVENWTLGQTLMITAGITPGILQSKTGFMNLRVPGTVPTDTELLVFIDVEPDRKTNRAARRKDAMPIEEDPFTEDETVDTRPERQPSQVSRKRTSRDDF